MHKGGIEAVQKSCIGASVLIQIPLGEISDSSIVNAVRMRCRG